MSPQEAKPPKGIFPGAVDHGDGRVTFALYAPGKSSVHLVGNFNDWDREADPMKATPEGLWWIEKELGIGSNAYQFLIDGRILITDPYARRLAEDAEYDPPRGIVDVGHPPYLWRDQEWKRPPFNELIIYELHLADFTWEGTLQAAIGKFEYLKKLGINAVELMPVTEFVGKVGWGYSPAYLFCVEKSYGSPDDLRRFVDEAHARGIAVILDIVLAHTAEHHPFNKMYLYEESPWYGEGLGERNQFGFPTLDYGKGPTQAFVRDVQTYWLREYHIDGFRYDYLWGIGYVEDKGLPFLVHSAREATPDAYLIGEYSPENPGAVNTSGLDAAWHISFSYGIKALLKEGEYNGWQWDDFQKIVEVLDPHNQGYDAASKMVTLLESHDEERLARVVQDAGMDRAASRFKSALGATILLSAPGVPMIYHGQEWGEDTGRNMDANVIHWDELAEQGGHGLFEHYQHMCRIRHDHPALCAESFAVDATLPGQKSLVYHRWNEEGDVVLVAANFSPADQEIDIPFPSDGRWSEAFTGESIDVQGSHGWKLGPSSAALFVHG